MALMLESYLPVVLLLGAGWAMTRWLSFNAAPLEVVLRYVLVPACLCHALLGGVRQVSSLWILALGALLAVIGRMAVSSASQSLKQNVDPTASIANIALFALPVLTIAWNLKRSLQMGLALLFIGAAVTHILLRERQNGLSTLVRQPWIYGVAIAALVQFEVIGDSILLRAIRPMSGAAAAMSLIFLGTLLPPCGGFARKDLWLTLAARLGVGLVVALVMVKIAPIPRFLQTTLIAGAMAPPATLSLAMIRDGAGGAGRKHDPQVVAVGIVAALVAYAAFPWYIEYLL